MKKISKKSILSLAFGLCFAGVGYSQTYENYSALSKGSDYYNQSGKKLNYTETVTLSVDNSGRVWIGATGTSVGGELSGVVIGQTAKGERTLSGYRSGFGEGNYYPEDLQLQLHGKFSKDNKTFSGVCRWVSHGRHTEYAKLKLTKLE